MGVTDIKDVAGVTDITDITDVADVTDIAGVMDVTDITGGTVRHMAYFHYWRCWSNTICRLPNT